MISGSDLARAFERNAMILKQQTEGLSHEDSLIQLPFRANCLNWVVGHIVVSRDDVLETLGEARLMGDVGTRYRRGSEALVEPDDRVLPLAELLDRLDQAQARIEAALTGMDEADLARQLRFGERTTTVGHRAFFLYFHESYHVGQTELLRQAAGKNDAII